MSVFTHPAFPPPDAPATVSVARQGAFQNGAGGIPSLDQHHTPPAPPCQDVPSPFCSFDGELTPGSRHKTAAPHPLAIPPFPHNAAAYRYLAYHRLTGHLLTHAGTVDDIFARTVTPPTLIRVFDARVGVRGEVAWNAPASLPEAVAIFDEVLPAPPVTLPRIFFSAPSREEPDETAIGSAQRQTLAAMALIRQGAALIKQGADMAPLGLEFIAGHDADSVRATADEMAGPEDAAIARWVENMMTGTDGRVVA